jgi:N-sulfoglucosamine sulfohydrolase
LTKTPNIIYIHSHDTGRYIQPYGHAVPTPQLQKLAEEGVLFRQNFCVNPTCSPSRAALLTGSYPHENGMTGLAHRGFALKNYKQHIVHTLKKAGYVTALTGTQHIYRGEEAWKGIGYDQFLGDLYDGTKGALEFLENPPGEPFFLTVGYGLTHRPFPKLEDCPDDPKYSLPPTPLPDTPETREDMVRFKASARMLDEEIGKVMEALEHSGCADNTVVVCTTDHGLPFPHMKCNLHDSGIGTLLIIRGPKGFSDGKVVDAMVSHLDIFPTLCEIANIPKPEWLRGKSLLPLVNDICSDIHEELFFEVNYHAAYNPMRAVRTKNFKYIRRFDGREIPILVNCDNGESKSYLLEHDWANKNIVEESLYDLLFDPNEMNNLACDPAFSSELTDMRERLVSWMKESNDPLLSGAVPAPEGANICDADNIDTRTKRNA